VINDYNDIGRTRWIRRSVIRGVERGTSTQVGERVYSLERDLQNIQTIKLEVIVLF
jgi:hypothetical protein